MQYTSKTYREAIENYVKDIHTKTPDPFPTAH